MHCRQIVALAAVVALTLALPGCGYSLSGRGSFLPAYIRVIGVPMFVNSTTVFDVEKRITDRVMSELIGRGKYTVKPDATGVDGLLTGEISSITLAPAAFTPDRQATRYALTLTALWHFGTRDQDLINARFLPPGSPQANRAGEARSRLPDRR